MYCSYNIKLFKNFTSMKTKIEPTMADDWEMIPATYRSTAGFKLYSSKLNQTVADIDLKRFLQFSKEQDLTIQGLKLQGSYIIGNDRSVYTEEMYNKWKEMFDTRVDNIIDKKDLIPGNKYETPCGSEFMYVGKFQYISFKKKLEDEMIVLSKAKYVHIVDSGGPSILNQKIRRDLGPVKNSEDKIETAIKKFQNLKYTGYLAKEKIKNPLVVFKETNKTPSYSNYMFKYEFAEVEYKGENIIISEKWEGYGSGSVYDYDILNEKAQKEYEDHLASGYNPHKPQITLTGIITTINDYHIFNINTLSFDRKTLKTLRHNYSFQRVKNDFDVIPIKYLSLTIIENPEK